jgi:predicted NUDIX family phosphoesterase
MSAFLDAAEQLLKGANEPMTAMQLTDRAIRDGLIQTSGLTPAQTMKAKLSTDIRRNGSRSRFMRTEAGRFGLRMWKGRLAEHHAKRFVPSLLDEDVLVFPISVLPRFVPIPGVVRGDIRSEELLGECYPMRRREAETRFDVVQLISVFLLHFGDKYLTYKRSRRLPEARLHHTHSIAFGGHLNPEDAPPLLDITVPDVGFSLIQRELGEEVKLPEAPTITYVGLLYDTQREVSKQHLGLVYDVRMASQEFAIGERGFLIDPQFETIASINSRIDEFENWTQVLVDFLRESRWQRTSR